MDTLHVKHSAINSGTVQKQLRQQINCAKNKLIQSCDDATLYVKGIFGTCWLLKEFSAAFPHRSAYGSLNSSAVS